jgi:Calcineurin-like phosphoesterase
MAVTLRGANVVCKIFRTSRLGRRDFIVSLFLLICGGLPFRAHSQTPTTNESFFTLVVMPDTQYYTETEPKTEKYFKGQTRWIVSNQEKEHIAFVFQLGDLQQDGNLLRLDKQPDPTVKELLSNPDPKHPPENTPQWERADSAMKVLDDAGVPYSAVPGNHDYFHWDRKTLPVNYLKYFGPQRYSGKSWFGGSSPAMGTSPAGMDMYEYFTAGGHKFLSIGLQFAPQAWDLDWAQKIVAANPGLPTIITTHAYISNDGINKDRRNIWDLLVRKNPQIFLTINGHINGHNEITEKDDAGLDVYEILVDYQDLKVPGYERGGGYMRLMRFYTDKNQIEVKTYSPVTEKFLDDPKDQFTLDCDFTSRLSPHTDAEKKQ